MAKSYYAILGVTSRATQADIKSAYRRLAKAYHPDRISGAEGAFREVQEAYDVLGDVGRRRDYDDRLSGGRGSSSPAFRGRPGARRPPASYGRARPAPEPLIPDHRPVDLRGTGAVHSFATGAPPAGAGMDWLGGNYTGLGQPHAHPVDNVILEVPLSRDQCRRGGSLRIYAPSRSVCPRCRGQGATGPDVCARCAGAGAITVEVPLDVAFPRGLEGDHAVVIPLHRYGTRNLRLTVRFRPASWFAW